MKNGWQRKQLGELAELKGRIGWRGLTAKEYTKSGPLFLSVHSLNYGDYVDFRDAFHISEERYVESPEIMLQKEDVLICKDGAGIGKVGIVGELPKRTTINSSLLLIRSGKEILPKFLYRCLSSPYFQQIVNSRLNGATTPHLYQRDITEFPVVLPPLPEQKRIVGILDEAFEDIATAKANAERNLQNARALFESHLQSVFTQGGPEWVEKTLGDVCDLFQGLCINAKTKHLLVEKGSLPLLRIKDLRANTAEQFVAESGWPKNAQVNESEIIYTRTGQIGLVFRGRAGVLHNNCFKVRPKPVLNSDYLFWWLQNPAFRTRITTLASRAAQPDITHSLFKVQPILLPPRDYQDKAIALIDGMREETERLATLYERKLAALEALKKSLLHQAFAGNL
jgi:type I restriction enzyme S subunit